MGPISNTQLPSVTVRQIDNGYEVHQYQESRTASPSGENYLYESKSITFAFPTAEEAFAKAQELLK